MKNNKIDYSVCIPVYNSENILEELSKRLFSVFEKITERYEILLVDDGSIDKSWEVMQKLREKNKRIKLIQLTKNYGQQNAMMCALSLSRGDLIITMDDDLQHPPEQIYKLIKCLKSNEHLDGVIGRPLVKKHNFFRRVGSLVVNKINNIIFHKPDNLVMSSFRILKRSIVEEIIKNKNHNPAIGSLLLSTTLNLKNVPFEHSQRYCGKSGYTLGRALKASFENIINFSTLPLKTISFFGIACSFISFIVALIFILRKLIANKGLQGWTSLLVMNLFFFGVILFSIGIIGEYIIRIIRQVNNQSQYVIRKKIIQ